MGKTSLFALQDSSSEMVGGSKSLAANREWTLQSCLDLTRHPKF